MRGHSRFFSGVFGQLAFLDPIERSRAFFDCGVATEGSVVSHIEKRLLIACRVSDLRSKQWLPDSVLQYGLLFAKSEAKMPPMRIFWG